VTERTLTLVDEAGVYHLNRKPETVNERVRRLQREAKVLACEEVEILRRTLAQAVGQAEAIRDGGDAFPVGVREQARRLAADLPLTMQTLQAISERTLADLDDAPAPPFWADR
jgi:hypothetical protein